MYEECCKTVLKKVEEALINRRTNHVSGWEDSILKDIRSLQLSGERELNCKYNPILNFSLEP